MAVVYFGGDSRKQSEEVESETGKQENKDKYGKEHISAMGHQASSY